MSVLRVNKITNATGTGPVEFSRGISLPSSFELSNSNFKINAPTGIMTAPVLNATTINLTGVCTATTFVGSVGSGLTGLSGTSNARAIALTLIT